MNRKTVRTVPMCLTEIVMADSFRGLCTGWSSMQVLLMKTRICFNIFHWDYSNSPFVVFIMNLALFGVLQSGTSVAY